MENEKMFELATRNKMRFPYKGLVSVEDLWDLTPRNLDSIFKVLNSQLKQVKEESLLDVRTKEDKELDLQIELVKYIVGVKLEEYELRKQAIEKKEKKQRLMAILAEKQDESLKSMSEEDIQKMLNEM